MITSPIIAQNTQATFNENLKELLPEADKFELDGTKLPEPISGTEVSGVYCGMNSDGEVVGYVADSLSTEGYGGNVKVMVGVDTEGRVSHAKVTEMSETPGLGAKCQTDWIGQYAGLSENIAVSKNGSEAGNPNKIDAISGATITSRAVTNAVNSSLEAVMAVISDNAPAEEGEEAAEAGSDAEPDGSADAAETEEEASDETDIAEEGGAE